MTQQQNQNNGAAGQSDSTDLVSSFDPSKSYGNMLYALELDDKHTETLKSDAANIIPQGISFLMWRTRGKHLVELTDKAGNPYLTFGYAYMWRYPVGEISGSTEHNVIIES